MGKLGEFIEEERDRRAVRAWYGNIAFLALVAVGLVVLAVIVIGEVAG